MWPGFTPEAPDATSAVLVERTTLVFHIDVLSCPYVSGGGYRVRRDSNAPKFERDFVWKESCPYREDQEGSICSPIAACLINLANGMIQ